LRDPILQQRARTLRLAATPAERAVWRCLRAPPFAALHFRRQVAFETRYIADFASYRARVIVEVDGWSHRVTDIADAARTAWFETRGYRVVRVANAVALDPDRDLGAVLAALIGVRTDA
jgi:very-short-patch-repair endonuclease